MKTILSITFAMLISLASVASRTVEKQQVGNYFQYTHYNAAFSWEQIMDNSMNMALESCQLKFKWQRWNCAASDFLLRSTITPAMLDREDVLVSAILTAAMLYTLTKECASGVVAGCGCEGDALNGKCPDEPAKAIELYEARYAGNNAEISPRNSYLTQVRAHNHQAVTKLLLDSLVTECSGTPARCIQVMKPFNDLAEELRHMYEDAVQLGATRSNLRIIWSNIPLDTFVYMKDSPNYCEPNADARWSGTRGRQCSIHALGEKKISPDQRHSCKHLCGSCGYRVRSELVRKERACKCKLVHRPTGPRLHCKTCVHTERQYFCY